MLLFLLAISDESDREKVEYLYRRYRSDMLRLAAYRLRQMGVPNSELNAEDVVQNAFVKIARHIGRIDFSLGEASVRSYVLKIVANETVTFVSDQVYCENLEQYQHALSDRAFFEQIRVSERYDAVVEAIEQLDERYSVPLSLRYVENLSVKEISAMLGIEEKSVYTRIDRGKRKLLEKLGGESP